MLLRLGSVKVTVVRLQLNIYSHLLPFALVNIKKAIVKPTPMKENWNRRYWNIIYKLLVAISSSISSYVHISFVIGKWEDTWVLKVTKFVRYTTHHNVSDCNGQCTCSKSTATTRITVSHSTATRTRTTTHFLCTSQISQFGNLLLCL